MRTIPTLLAALALATLPACGGPGGGGGNDGGVTGYGLKGNWTSIKGLMPSCALSNACHATGAGHPVGHIILEPSVAYQNIVGQNSVEIPQEVLIDPGHPDSSYLLHKLEGTQKSVCQADSVPTFNCGIQMPNGGPYLSASDIQAVKTWIANGATQN